MLVTTEHHLFACACLPACLRACLPAIGSLCMLRARHRD
eukprot:COSAG01_NODE_42189_length_442_cov_2.402332_1_plen_38_part_10